jgi:GGDEF domain-containing protein
VTASFGVAELPLDAIDADSLVREADRALYAAKQAGRDQVVTAQPTEAVVGVEL